MPYLRAHMTRADLGDTLALVNALLNAASAVLLASGRLAIARGTRKLHRALMITAFLTSCTFLASYLTRMALTGAHRDPHTGMVHVAYIALLGSHMLLAIAVVPLVLRTLWLAYKDRFAEHRKLAAVTFPIWLYVSVTGVLVYLMLYRLPV